MHLSFENEVTFWRSEQVYKFNYNIEDIDSLIFYHVSTSFFTMDDRINSVIRKLITEVEGC